MGSKSAHEECFLGGGDYDREGGSLSLRSVSSSKAMPGENPLAFRRKESTLVTDEKPDMDDCDWGGGNLGGGAGGV